MNIPMPSAIKDLMRNRYLVLILFGFLASCGGRKLSGDKARDLIIHLPQEALQKEDIEVVNIRQVGGSEAVLETRLKTAFRLEKDGDEWVVRDVRVGNGQWEKVKNLQQALTAVRIEETRDMLDRIIGAIRKYRETNGSLPACKDYVALSDLLSPAFLTPLIRLDAWRQPLAAAARNNSITVWSAGPDGKHGTADDIRGAFPP